MIEVLIASYVVLWLLVMGLVGTQFALFRHLGHQLLNSPERKTSQGPEIGTKIPAARLTSLAGHRIDVGMDRERPAFIYVAQTVCDRCLKSREALGRFSRRYATDLQTILICRGRTDAEVREFAAELPTTVEVVSDRDGVYGARLHISHTPFAFIVDRQSTVRGKGSPDDDLAFAWFRQQLRVADGELEPTIALVSER